MNISPLLFAVFSGGVVLCQPSLCSSQSWEIKCLQQYCAGVMLNQHAGLASVNPNVSRQRLFSEQRSQGWSQGDLCDCQMESRSLIWWRNLPTFLLWYAPTLLRKGRAADRSEKIAPKWELAQRHLVDLWGVHSNVKLLHEWWKCRASHGTCDTVSYASASGLLIYEEYVQTDWNKACSWTNGGESLFPPSSLEGNALPKPKILRQRLQSREAKLAPPPLPLSGCLSSQLCCPIPISLPAALMSLCGTWNVGWVSVLVFPLPTSAFS